MKKILFVITNFRHGGTNKSLENLLSIIDKERFSIDVFGMEHQGPYLNMLNGCNILPKNRIIHSLIGHLKDLKGSEKFFGAAIKILRKVSEIFDYDLTNILFQKASDDLIAANKYDAVIAYSEGVPTLFVSKINHHNNIAWVHCDYSNYMQINNAPNELDIYNKYKSIVCVSEFTMQVFVRIFPEFKDKVCNMHNCINDTYIKKLSMEAIYDSRFKVDKFTIISIGRIDVVKNFEIIPKIVNDLKKISVDFKWYLIGPEGVASVQESFVESINRYDVSEYFEWLGPKDNPYKYLSKCNLLVMTSKSEACPYVLNESKILKIPVVTTNYGSAYEFLINDFNGKIVSENELSITIQGLLNGEYEYTRLVDNLSEFEYDNSELISKFYRIVS